MTKRPAAPGDPGGEGAAEQQADAAAGTGDGAVPGDRAGAGGALGEADGEQGEGRRGGDRGADPLQGAGAEQPGRRLGDAAEHRGEGEEGDAGDEDLAAAEDVAGPGAEQEQTAEGQRVGVLHPGEAGGGEAEVLVDARQRRDHHRDVEDDHQVAAEDDREDEGGVAVALESHEVLF